MLADGQGLGIQFLKHLTRCRLLLHMIDIAGSSTTQDAVTQFRMIENELEQYSVSLADKDRWLVL